MRVLFIATEPAPGMRPFVATIMAALDSCAEFDVRLLAVNKGNQTFTNLISHNILRSVEYPSNTVKKALYKIYPRSIIKAIKEEIEEYTPDVVNFITGDFSMAFTCMAGILDFPFYYTVHDLFPHEHKGLKGNLFDRYIQWGNARMKDMAKVLTTSSKFQFEYLKGLGMSIGFTAFPSLITDAIRSGKKVPKEIAGEKKYILFFGNVDLYKGTDLLESAWEFVQSAGEHKLIIAGCGLGLSSKKNDSIIRINRFIEDDEVQELFLNAGIVVYPYRSATMSGVLSLAYYFKKKVVCSDLDFFMQYPSDNTFYFERDNVNSLVNAIECAYRAPYVDDGAYENYYSEKQLIEDYCRLYEIDR